MSARRIVGLVLWLVVALGPHPGAEGQGPGPAPDTPGGVPPRLAFVDGQVSFWRPGAQEWVQAQVNTPLAPGDELYTGSPGNLELQIGVRAFVRAWGATQIGLVNQEPDFLQFKVTGGYASFDVRSLDAGRTIEVDTPNAALTIEHAGYYRVDVSGARTSVLTRRGARARVTTATGETVAITPSEEIVIEGTAPARVASYVAPPLDAWDQWNYARTDGLLEAVSARYVSADVYGASDLDRYGTWRVVPSYGSVWVPAGVTAGWAPYTTGAWTLDPHYGWTWIDTAPWGWAPYHHGRWVYVDGIWAWAPGPVVARAVYAPALVAFLGDPGVRVGGPLVGWVALGWGEPLVPWWGPVGHVHVASWAGWGGPRVVNNVVVERTTIVDVTHITVYRNASVRNAVVVVREEHFGRGPVAGRMAQVDVARFHPVHTGPRVSATPMSFVATSRRGVEPPRAQLAIPVVATRAPRGWSEPAMEGHGDGHKTQTTTVPAPSPRLVSPPPREPSSVPYRPPFGESKTERTSVGREPSASPPRATPRLEPSPTAPQGTSRGGPSPTSPQGTPRGGPSTTSPQGTPRGGPSTTAPQGTSRSGSSTPAPQATPRSGPPAASPQASPRSAPSPGSMSSQPGHGSPQGAPSPQVTSDQRGGGQRSSGQPLPGEPANRLNPSRGSMSGSPQPPAPGGAQPSTERAPR